MHIAQVMGGIHLQVRTCAGADEPPLSYLGNGWTDYAEIWRVVRDQLARYAFYPTQGWGASARAHPLVFFISVTAGRIALKFGMLLETI